MPELPEVETVRRGLAPVMTSARIEAVVLRRKNLRFAFPAGFAERLAGRTVMSLGRRAKYLLGHLEGGETLIMHLGMSGRFRIVEGEANCALGQFHHGVCEAQTHDHVVFHLSNGAQIIYNDARRFGFMDLVATPTLDECRHFKAMGLEPLDGALTGETLAQLFVGKRTPLKATLLDQRLIAGLGNIYVCEALFRTRLSPTRPAGTLVTPDGSPTSQAMHLARVIQDVLLEAIAAGGSTLRDHAQVNGELGYFQHRFHVYDREGEPCVACAEPVQRIVQSGRSTFFCAACQG